MMHIIPAGSVALTGEEMDNVVGGSLWRPIAAAAAFGFTVGRWLACAFECVVFDG